ncbi:hypothetical protein ACVWWW_002764 [Lysobacter sp. HA18]
MPVVTPSAASMLTVKLVWCGEVLSPHHRRQAELSATLARQRHAHQPPRMRDHEVDVLRPHEFRGHDQVAFVLAILVVDDDDHSAGADFFQQFGNRREAHARSPVSRRST